MDISSFMEKIKNVVYKQLVVSGIKDANIIYSNSTLYVKYKDKEGAEEKFLIEAHNIYGVYKELKEKGHSDDDAFDIVKRGIALKYDEVSEINMGYEHFERNIYPKVYAKVSNDIHAIVVSREFIADHLYVYYVIDYEDKMVYVTKALFKDWGISMDQLDAAAKINFNRDTDKDIIGVDVADMDEKVFIIGKSSDYEPSKLLFTGVFDVFEKNLAGSTLVIVPNRDTLFVFTDSNILLVNSMKALAYNHYITRPYPVSVKMFRYKKGLFSVVD